MEQQLLGYEDTMYRLDEAEHIAGRLDQVRRGQTVTNQMDCEAYLVPQHGLQRAGAGRHRGAPVEVHERVHHAVDRGILFSDASDSRVHIRWLPLLKDLETCGRLSWGSAVLAWLYCQMCRATEHGQCNLGGCVSLLLS
ncbi:hypothetical protein Ahy_B09g098712 [Arachis hypogaea]|uniref:Aminotransferase-like plant mobile domain-containing protein n=1 Tax=Arachis hypogaea TaxID=3818 RepID=A0A444XRY1_ARAHY|nr:hypothetical protein Ahy_B09g098712 [Arachis hypogaea]